MKVRKRTVRNSSRPPSASFRTCLRTLGVILSSSASQLLPRLLPPLLRRDAAVLQLLQAGHHGALPHPPAWVLGPYRTLQMVIDTVPLGEVAEDVFGYFEPLYQVIPDMPRPPETFLRRVTGWKEQVLNGDAEAAPEPRCLPKEPAPPSPESQPPRDQDSEVFCDSVEQLEPELVGEEQRGAVGGEMDTRNSPEPPAERGRLEGPLLGPQELDSWLVGTVRALQESMRDVQGRLQSLESMPVPPEQQMPPPSARPWPLRLSGPTLIFFLLWPFIVQWLFRQFRTQKR
ncbi:acyl-CoA-binding domain-containing protein 4 isoform X4 [Odocoileus virginianus]|uniref:Acyl-CoA-binding domain-containing protein 4 isoform X4 n=1 Tax=Odocoileus virginianus TaxID=9874 RepID=A0ABM4J6P7_ODOVR